MALIEAKSDSLEVDDGLEVASGDTVGEILADTEELCEGVAVADVLFEASDD